MKKGHRPPTEESHDQDTKSSLSVSGDEQDPNPKRPASTGWFSCQENTSSHRLETSIAGAPEGCDIFGQGISYISPGKDTLIKKGDVSNNTPMTSVQLGKNGVPQEGGASAAESSAGTSRSRNTLCKRDIRWTRI